MIPLPLCLFYIYILYLCPDVQTDQSLVLRGVCNKNNKYMISLAKQYFDFLTIRIITLVYVVVCCYSQYCLFVTLIGLWGLARFISLPRITFQYRLWMKFFFFIIIQLFIRGNFSGKLNYSLLIHIIGDQRFSTLSPPQPSSSVKVKRISLPLTL